MIKQRKVNVFVFDEDKSMGFKLKDFLEKRFGEYVTVSIYDTGESCLLNVNKTTNVVILDYLTEDKNGLEILKFIKKRNPKTEVIMFSNNEDIMVAIETYRAGAKDYVIKGKDSWNIISKLILRVITKPVRLLVKEFGISKYMAIFLTVFVTMGIVVYFVIKGI